MIDLTSSRVSISPKETLENLAQSCQELNINSFDVYGDYMKDNETSWLRQFGSSQKIHVSFISLIVMSI